MEDTHKRIDDLKPKLMFLLLTIVLPMVDLGQKWNLVLNTKDRTINR